MTTQIQDLVANPRKRRSGRTVGQASNVRADSRYSSRAPRHKVPRELCCFRDDNGGIQFNFKQRMWPNRTAMDFTSIYTPSLRALAVNILYLATTEARTEGSRVSAAFRQDDFVDKFCQDVLLGAPQEGWSIAIDTVRAWVNEAKTGEGARGNLGRK